MTSANSGDNNGSVLLGNGTGSLAAPTTYSTDSFPLATDVADLDGDGDLDWVTASFSGDWFVFTNDGDGTFTFNQEIDAPVAASCSLAVDIDNDHDLDLALIDELDDVVILMRNGGHTTVANSYSAIHGLLSSGTISETSTSNDSYLCLCAFVRTSRDQLTQSHKGRNRSNIDGPVPVDGRFNQNESRH